MLAPVSSPSFRPELTADGPLVLIVEDDEDTRFLYAESLVHLGCRAAGEPNAASGIQAAFRLRPDAILMDLTMPGMGAIEAIRQLKADPRTTECLIVVVTGSDMKWFAAAREAGCDVFCGKPFDPYGLVHLLAAPPELAEPTLAPSVVKRCSCGRELTRTQWLALALCGRMHLLRRNAVVELRNCSCGSSLTLRIDDRQKTEDDSTAAAGQPVADAPLGRIVVVERDVHVRRLVLHFIGSAYLVEFLDDGYTALDRVRKAPPTALVAEIMIPRLDGLNLCRLLKGDSRTATVPVALMSRLAASERARQAGADVFVAKPLEKQLFVSSLLGLVEKHE
jgi:CheY-like chemotaxis protein